MSSPVLVVDTSVWIDLAKNGLLEYMQHLPYEIVISHFVWNELNYDPTSEELQEYGFSYREFAAPELDSIVRLKAKYRGLSMPDASNLALAHILTGRNVVFLASADSRLRKAAVEEGLSCKDALDLLDEWVQGSLISLAEARSLACNLGRGRPTEVDARYQILVAKWEAAAGLS